MCWLKSLFSSRVLFRFAALLLALVISSRRLGSMVSGVSRGAVAAAATAGASSRVFVLETLRDVFSNLALWRAGRRRDRVFVVEGIVEVRQGARGVFLGVGDVAGCLGHGGWLFSFLEDGMGGV
ncbi:hypothetical protein BDZ88DRAFT_429518 [Geranomyces variabilis]|nr:hypothetical protein BDZ88DRAFT_429518 [Geranomyces variabilis]